MSQWTKDPKQRSSPRAITSKSHRRSLFAFKLSALIACMQCGPDLLDGPITIIPVFIDSAAPATQSGVSKMSTAIHQHGRVHTTGGFHMSKN